MEIPDVTFANVPTGSLFTYDEEYYVKVDKTQASDLQTGGLTSFDSDEDIVPVDLEFKIKRVDFDSLCDGDSFCIQHKKYMKVNGSQAFNLAERKMVDFACNDRVEPTPLVAIPKELVY